MNADKIPRTDSIQELARFWDTHDLTDYEGELEEVEGPVFERRRIVQVPLSPKEADAVKQMAKSAGMAPEDLIGKWVKEKVGSS